MNIQAVHLFLSLDRKPGKIKGEKLKELINNIISFFDNKDESHLLKQQHLLKDLSHFELKNVEKYLIERKFKAGEMIYRENYPHVVLYMIKSGQVEIYLEQSPANVIFATLGPNEHFGEIGMFNESSRITSARAITDCELLAVSKYDFVKLISKYPSAGIKILFKIAESISQDVVRWIKSESK